MFTAKDVDKLCFYIIVGFAFVSLPLKFCLLAISDVWFDYSNIIAAERLAGSNSSDLFLLFLLVLSFFLLLCFSLRITIGLLGLSYTVNPGAKISMVAALLLLFCSLLLMYAARKFNLFHVGIEAEALPLKMYGQLKILALCCPVFLVFYLYSCGIKFLSLILLVSICLFNVSISGSKFSLLAPLLLFIFLTNEKRMVVVGGAVILTLYTIFNPYAFRGYIVENQGAFSFSEMFMYVLEDSFSFERFIQSLVILIDRFPGADVIVNVYFLVDSDVGQLNVNRWYNDYVLNASLMKGSFATSFIGYIYLLLGLWSYLLLPIFLLFLFVFRKILSVTLSHKNMHIFNCVFFVFFIALILDGNLHLLYTYTSLYYIVLVLLIVQLFSNFLGKKRFTSVALNHSFLR